MKIEDFLSPSDIAIEVRAADKTSLLKDLAARAASTLGLSGDTIASEIEKRDELGSTGIGAGVAIPHARFREVARSFGLLVRLKQPIEFNAIDGQPVDIVFPAHSAGGIPPRPTQHTGGRGAQAEGS